MELSFLVSLFFFSIETKAQDSIRSGRLFAWSGFVETYYSYDFNQPADHLRPPFLYNYKRHNELAVNLASLGMSVSADNYRAKISLMAGTYAQYNLANEPAVFQYVYEANAGVRLGKTNLWIDAGIMPSHIGFETAISKNCWTLTRSIMAENSPYYETGFKLSYTSPNNKWFVSALVLNGWQRIQRVEGNNTPAFGTQVTFTPSKTLTINSSSFAGNDKPDSVKQWRYFHDLYLVWQVAKKLGITIGFDLGAEQQRSGDDLNYWYAPIAIIRYQLGQWAVAARAEYYDDKTGVIVPLVNSQPFKMLGYSLNIDRMFNAHVLWRMESRWLKNDSPYFTKQTSLVKDNLCITTSLLFSLD